jgi:dolichyl-diphosphooligosaccharide--protein glycosyltransferase
MSNWREQLSEEQEAQAVVTLLEKIYHIPVLFVLVGYVFLLRFQHWSNFVIDGEVFYGGNDPYYHLRSVQYTVENFPSTIPYDPWTNFPTGTSADQFTTIFDQIIALVALVVGMGNPSDSLVRHIFLVAPPFVAVLICIPTYFIGRRLGGRIGGIVSVGIIALAPDRLLLISLAGRVDHHVAEVFLMSLSVLGVMVALSVAEKEKPVYELARAGNFGSFRRTIGWSMLAGVAMGLYMWTWPPGVWIFGTLGIFFVVYMSIEHVRGRSPEHGAIAGVLSMTTAAVLQLSTLRELSLSAASRSILQPGLPLLVAAGLVFLAWLSRQFDTRDQRPALYPVAVFSAILGTAVFAWLVLPDVFEFFVHETNRVLGFITSPSEEVGTIGEAEGMDFSEIRQQYQFATFTAGLGALVLIVKQFLDDEPNGEHLLVVVWAVFILFASLTQLRFSYYLPVIVGVLSAALVGFVIKVMGTPEDDIEFESYQVLTVTVIILVMFGPLLGLPLISVDSTASDVAANGSSPGDVMGWDDSLEWMDENTPKPGQYANPDGDPMDYSGTFKRTDDYEYPRGAYGVISWWDYGHWITSEANRIPTANPFQQGTRTAADFLLAQSEEKAQDVLSETDDHEWANTKYVMIDWKMVQTESAAGGKFFAPPQFHDEYEQRDFTKRLYQTDDQDRIRTRARIQNQMYYEAMMVRLYHYHGSSFEPKPLVVEWTGEEEVVQSGPLEGQAIIRSPQGGQAVTLFQNMTKARQYVEENPSAQIGGLGALPSERVPALEQFRLVHMDEVPAIPRTQEHAQLRQHGVQFTQRAVAQRNIWATGLANELQVQLREQGVNASQEQLQQMAAQRGLQFLYPNTMSWTKTFERVPGATIEGTGPANEVITVQVEMNPENGQPFTYKQEAVTDSDGHFEVVVPYSTTGYENWGPEEGYTNTSVRATGPYRITTQPTINDNGTQVYWGATVNVSEAKVIGEDTEPATVELKKQEIQIQTGDPEDAPGNDDGEDGDSSSDGSQDDGSSDGSNETDGGAYSIHWPAATGVTVGETVGYP